jgi:hypothetical protein
MRSSALLLASLAVGASLPVGCAAPERATLPVPSALTTIGLGAHAPAIAAVSAADLAPGRPGDESWIALDGLEAPGHFAIRTEPTTLLGAAFLTKTGSLETAYWSEAEDGSLLLHCVDSHPDRARTIFDPPLPIAPPSLESGAEHVWTSAMRVVVLPAATRERAKGEGTRTMRLLREEFVEVESGDLERASVVEVLFRADLDTAKAERRSEILVLPGRGTVGRRWKERLVILGLFPTESGQSSVRQGIRLATGGDMPASSPESAPTSEPRP